MTPETSLEPSRASSRPAKRWASWWAYVLVILPANFGKEQLLPGEAAWWLRAALTAAIVTVGIAVVTAFARSWPAARTPRGA
jgi:hypothetical protein